MENNNCNHQNEAGIFCGQCGVALKEKCPECEKMEKIGRAVCETLFEKIYEEKWKFIFNHTKKISPITLGKITFLEFLIAIQVVIAIFAGIILLCSLFGWMKDFVFPYALLATLFFGIGSWLSNKAVTHYISDNEKKIDKGRKIAEEKFFAENPQYAEILKQAEENGNG